MAGETGRERLIRPVRQWDGTPLVRAGAILLPVAALLYALYLVVFPQATLRYRLTLEADAGGNRHLGSGVIEVLRQDTTAVFKNLGGVGAVLTGEAVVLDLGAPGIVFMVLSSDRDADAAASLPYEAFRSVTSGDPIPDTRELQNRKPKAELRFAQLPTLVTFKDLSDPKTARVVRPDMFEQEFGPGVRFRRATIEIVDAGTWPFTWIGWPRSLAGEPVTRGIEKKLPWWNGPFPWLRPIGGGTYVDTRQDGFKWNKSHFRKGF